MVYEFELPDVGEGISEAEIVNWLVDEGDRVEEEESIVEVETDKAIVEIPSPVTGVVKQKLVEVGDTVKVEDTIVTFQEDSGTSDGAEGEAEETPETQDQDSQREGELGTESGSSAGDTETEPSSSSGEESGRVFAPPRVRKLARKLGVDIGNVEGSGERNGDSYVKPGDVEMFAESQSASAPASGFTSTSTATQSASTSSGSGVESGDGEVIGYSGVRKTIGDQMSRAASEVPHVTHHDRVDVSELVELRDNLDVDVTYTPFIVKAVIEGLREYPIFNSKLDLENEEIVVEDSYNIGVATATESGLMVPVVRDADEKSVVEIMEEIRELAGKARDRKIQPSEMEDGTFTLTNIGAIGGDYATPIVNYPEAAILAAGSIEPRATAVERDGEHVVEARHTLPLSLSFDHRVTDGAEAAGFTNTVMRYLGNPGELVVRL